MKRLKFYVLLFTLTLNNPVLKIKARLSNEKKNIKSLEQSREFVANSFQIPNLFKFFTKNCLQDCRKRFDEKLMRSNWEFQLDFYWICFKSCSN